MELGKQKLGAYVEASEKLEDGKLKLELDISFLAVAGPVLDKLAELIPGHFEDALIAEAKQKLAELAAAK
jgi:hypothetical protein